MAAQNGQVPALTSAAGGSAASGTASSGASSPAGSNGFTVNGFFPEEPLSSVSQVGKGAAPAAAKAAGKANSTKVLLVQLPPVTDTALWTKDLSVGLLLTLAVLVALAVCTTFLLGRRRQRW